MKSIIGWFYYIFALIWSFKFWGIGWGLVSIFFPIFPLIDLAQYAVAHLHQ